MHAYRTLPFAVCMRGKHCSEDVLSYWTHTDIYIMVYASQHARDAFNANTIKAHTRLGPLGSGKLIIMKSRGANKTNPFCICTVRTTHNTHDTQRMHAYTLPSPPKLTERRTPHAVLESHHLDVGLRRYTAKPSPSSPLSLSLSRFSFYSPA